jgi:hypothetical protein
VNSQPSTLTRFAMEGFYFTMRDEGREKNS